MTLDEAITHAREKAEELKRDSKKPDTNIWIAKGCLECAKEHEQLADWLEELKARREADTRPQLSDDYFYDEGYAQGYIDGSTGADWEGGAE